MQHLLNVEVHYNWLDGQVPEEWWTSSRWAMQRLNIAANQFSGTVPTEIGLLNGLKGFFSFENEMTGTLPTEVSDLSLQTSVLFSTCLLIASPGIEFCSLPFYYDQQLGNVEFLGE